MHTAAEENLLLQLYCMTCSCVGLVDRGVSCASTCLRLLRVLLPCPVCTNDRACLRTCGVHPMVRWWCCTPAHTTPRVWIPLWSSGGAS